MLPITFLIALAVHLDFPPSPPFCIFNPVQQSVPISPLWILFHAPEIFTRILPSPIGAPLHLLDAVQRDFPLAAFYHFPSLPHTEAGHGLLAFSSPGSRPCFPPGLPRTPVLLWKTIYKREVSKFADRPFSRPSLSPSGPTAGPKPIHRRICESFLSPPFLNSDHFASL